MFGREIAKASVGQAKQVDGSGPGSFLASFGHVGELLRSQRTGATVAQSSPLRVRRASGLPRARRELYTLGHPARNLWG